MRCLHLAAGDELEVVGPVAGEPAVHAGRHVHDAPLHPRLRSRLRHPPQQELRQQEMAQIVGGEGHLHAVLRHREPLRVLPRVVSARTCVRRADRSVLVTAIAGDGDDGRREDEDRGRMDVHEEVEGEAEGEEAADEAAAGGEGEAGRRTTRGRVSTGGGASGVLAGKILFAARCGELPLFRRANVRGWASPFNVAPIPVLGTFLAVFFSGFGNVLEDS